MSLQSLEQQIVAEYGIVKGWIATHVYSSVIIAFALGAVFGHVI